MAQRRPVSFLVFAILNFVAAVAFTGCGICTNISDGSQWHVEINGVRWDEKKLNAHLKQKVPAYTALKVTGIVTGYLVFVGLILAGIAMLFGGMLGKIAALLVYALGFLHHVAMILIQLILFNPATNQFFDTIPQAIFVGGGAREATRYTALFPSYLAIAMWIVGILFYLVAGLIVALSSTAAPDDGGKKSKKSKGREEEDETDDDEEEDDEEEERPQKKRPKPRRDDDVDEDDDDAPRSGSRRPRR